MIIFAEASNQFAGNAFYFVGAAVGIIGGLAALAGYFATRRDVDAQDKRISTLEATAAAIRAEMKEDKEELIAIGERRSFVLHNRINPIIENTAGLKASQEAFVVSFDNFTSVMKDMTQAIRDQRPNRH